MEIKLSNAVDNPIGMVALPTHTNIVISCDKGQNIQIEQLLSSVNINPQSNIIDLKIENKRLKRSRNANAYMWVLCDKIAYAINATKEDVYRDAIRFVGVFADVGVQEEAIDALIADWNSHGIGWYADIFDSGLEDKYGNPMKRVRLYKGSSRYDKKQMSRLIDFIVNEAKNLGIETETPEEIERMKSTWGEI